MSIKIKHKRNATDGSKPTTAQLDNGEIAVNYSNTDPALYIKDSTGAVIRIAGGGAVGVDLQAVTGTGNTTTNSVLIGGTLPTAPNISLNPDGSAVFAGNIDAVEGTFTDDVNALNAVITTDINLGGDIINTVTDGDQDIICDGSGLIEVTEYNLTPMEVVTKHDIGTAANEVPLNGFLGTLAYKDDLAIADGLAVADLPTSPTVRVGNITRVTDGAAALTWGATVTGGGTAQYLVWYNGTNWTVFGA